MVGLLWTTVFRLARCATICPMRAQAETRFILEFGDDRENVQRTAKRNGIRWTKCTRAG